MILRAARKWLRRRKAKEPRRLPAKEHGIRPEDIGKNALTAVQKLARHGYTAYIVGGAVRDLLLGIAPKDFDLATDATPAQVRRLFRNSRTIGRRFRLIHLYFGGGQIIEVATFRDEADESAREESGRILRDNRFGDAEADARRRDFTANALFYDPDSGEVLDYIGGVEDIRRRRLRIIGDGEERIREDPVRMLRALRLAAKTRLAIAPADARLFAARAELLADISPARLLDEFIKIARSGCCAVILRNWHKHRIAECIFPQIAPPSAFCERACAEADKRAGRGKAVSVSFVAAAIYWDDIGEKWRDEMEKGARPVRAMENALGKLDFLNNRVLSRRVAARMTDLYFLLARMKISPPGGRARCERISGNSLFSRALAFAELEDDLRPLAEWWQAYAEKPEREKTQTLSAAGRKRRRRPAKTTGEPRQ